MKWWSSGRRRRAGARIMFPYTIQIGKSLHSLSVGNKCADLAQTGQLVRSVADRYRYLPWIVQGLVYMEGIRLDRHNLGD
jgi:hypothetical protein